MKRTIRFALAMLCLAFVACNLQSMSQKPKYYSAEISDAGVVVHGYACPGYIQNNNQTPVRIKQVWIFYGEETQWIKVFSPGERQDQYISHQHGFHIYNMDGVEIGWIHPSGNIPTN